MRIRKTNTSSKKPLIIIGIVVAVLLVGLGTAYAIKLNNDTKIQNQKPAGINYSPPTDEQIKNGTSTKQGSVDGAGSDTPVAPTPQPGSSLSTVEVSMTSANQNGNQYQVRFQIDADTSDGSCTITLSKDGKVLTYSAGIQVYSKVASCQGFNIPIDANNLSKGLWQLNMNYSSTTLSGSLNTNIEVK